MLKMRFLVFTCLMRLSLKKQDSFHKNQLCLQERVLRISLNRYIDAMWVFCQITRNIHLVNYYAMNINQMSRAII